ncbi:LOW QUALITY PROTEIN: Hypothetical protein PHPALM_14213 [Phytophthora palmivora]|uniref:Uncharacterized protein n=1 Tax=Phytophthora palmivora TaxID=4796 RepID=A0A2P4XVB4_9STRA|nr:LOW QUALITY PROTEIN: Hypothetical protein PHPALM_14213 [Phytophthora palmivora]
MVSGKRQLPIRGIDDVIIEVMDIIDASRQLDFRDVLFEPEMISNQFSIAQVLKTGIRLPHQVTFFVNKDYKIQVELAADMDLFQLKIKTPY